MKVSLVYESNFFDRKERIASKKQQLDNQNHSLK